MVYRLSGLSYAIAKRVVDVPHVAMVNLIAGRRLVPELIQNDFTADNIVSSLRPMLDDEAVRSTLQTGLAEVRAALELRTTSSGTMIGEMNGQAIERVAQIALSYTQKWKPATSSTVPVG